MSKLTLKQKRFADEYIISGNATEAAIKAGYSKNTARFIGAENLTKPNIAEYLEVRLKRLEDEKIADMKEVFQFWTATLRDESEDTRRADRLKASEYLARANGGFIDRLEVTAEISTSESIKLVDDYLAKVLNDRKG